MSSVAEQKKPKIPKGKNKAKDQTAPKAKVGPSVDLSVYDWKTDPQMKDSFIMWLAGGPKGARQFTFHRPIGVSGIEEEDKQWVATFTSEVGFLLKNSKPAALLSWEKKSREQAEKDLLKHAGNGRISKGEVIVWEGSDVACATEIQRFIAAAKTAGKPESEWLSFAPEEIQVQERLWRSKKSSAKPSAAWLADNSRPTSQTFGGPLGDQPQKAVPYLKGKSAASAQDSVLRVALGFEVPPSSQATSSSSN